MKLLRAMFRPVTSPLEAFGIHDGRAQAVVVAGLLLRMVLVVVSCVVPGYDDIDYTVFTEGALEAYNGRSPYDRATFRYTPVLAWALIPNVWWHPFGKVLFSLCDVVIAILAIRIMMWRGLPQRTAAYFVGLCFLLHPYTINVSTRGNADAIVCALVLALLYCLLHPGSKKRVDLAAFFYGAAVHTKIYPFIFAVPLLAFMDKDYAPQDFVNQEGNNNSSSSAAAAASDDVAPTSSSLATVATKRKRAGSASPAPTKRREPTTAAAAPLSSAALATTNEQRDESGSRLSLALGHYPAVLVRALLRVFFVAPLGFFVGLKLPLVSGLFFRPMHSFFSWCHDFVTPRKVGFGLVSLLTFSVLTAVCYAFYGWTFLWESYLYHLVRTDNRHNFSPYFYDLYLKWDANKGPATASAATDAVNNTEASVAAVEQNESSLPLRLALGIYSAVGRALSSRTGMGLLSFLPQFGTLIALGFFYARDLPMALFLQTIVFVAWNKVITVQYFHWYLSLAPLVLPQSSLAMEAAAFNKRAILTGVALALIWLLTEVRRCRRGPSAPRLPALSFPVCLEPRPSLLSISFSFSFPPFCSAAALGLLGVPPGTSRAVGLRQRLGRGPPLFPGQRRGGARHHPQAQLRALLLARTPPAAAAKVVGQVTNGKNAAAHEQAGFFPPSFLPLPSSVLVCLCRSWLQPSLVVPRD